MPLIGTNSSWKIKALKEHSAAVNLPKNNIEPHKSFTGCYKKLPGSGLTPIYTKYKK